jgi:SAM-dependent methyltransferase
MNASVDISRLFDPRKMESYDFSQAPRLVTLKKDPSRPARFGQRRWLDWSKAQKSFLKRRRRRKALAREHVLQDKRKFDLLFGEKQGPAVRGNVLDIGGGMGLCREWWSAGESEVFVVHDPGVERVTGGFPIIYQECYARAFGLPMTFVEGFGEDLPYRDEQFDTCIIAAALDHCLNPEAVLREACRRLKRRHGVLLVIQSCRETQAPPSGSDAVRRFLGDLLRPWRLASRLYHRLFYPDTHLHAFDREGLTASLRRIGFEDVRSRLLPHTTRVWVFEARKA